MEKRQVSLASLEVQITEILEAVNEEVRRHTRRKIELYAERKRLFHERAALLAGLDVERINRARRFIAVYGNYDACFGERDRVIDAAADDIAHGLKNLRARRPFIKDYGSFVGQFGWLEYGYKPSHGHVVFEIGLDRDFTDGSKEPEARNHQFTEDEIEDMLYYVRTIPTYHAARPKGS